MALADDLAAISVPVKGPACRIGRWLGDQSAADQAEIIDAFRDGRVTDRVLGEWLSKQVGFRVTLNVVGHHRRGGCASCNRNELNMVRGG